VLNVLNKLWTAFFVAVVLFVPAVVVGTLVNMANPGCFSCGAEVASAFWMMGIGAHPSVWATNNLSSRRRLTIWLTAMTVGVITYIGLALIEGKLLSLILSGDTPSVFWPSLIRHAQGVFWLGIAISGVPVMVASVVSGVLVRRSPRRGQVASPSAATRQSTQDLKTQMTVTGKVQNESQIQTDGASVGSLRVRETRPPTDEHRTQGGEAIAMTRAWRIALTLFALAVVAAVLVASFVEQRHRQKPEPQASTEHLPNPYDEILRLRDGGAPPPARGAPVAVLSIDALLAEYRENEFAAAAKYENPEPLRHDCLFGDRSDGCRVVEISGNIRDMGRDDKGVAYIWLATAPIGVIAQFGFAEQDSLQTVRRGQHISVRCMVTYRSLAGLSLTRCGVAP
jgi:hypothetical protein